MIDVKNFQPNESKVLATYCTYKTLYEQKKDAYDIVAGFIKYAVAKDRSREYSLINISDLIAKEFGLNIPDYVIKTAIKRLKFITKRNQIYMVIFEEHNPQGNFSDIQNNSLERAKIVFSQLNEYAKENIPEIKDEKDNKKIQYLHTCFFKYLVDERVDDKMATYISNFTIKCTPDTRDIIDSMRAGHILYWGLKNNDHLDEISSWKTPLTLFLDMEILFHIAGYNGIVYKRLADELLSLINDVNKKQRYISLRYFTSTKESIERFFVAAENKYRLMEAPFEQSTAMEAILNNCKMASDILDKKSDFFRLLTSKSIIEDNYKDYYDKNLSQYNLEGIDISDEKYHSICNGNEEKIKLEERIKMISHINKRRRGKIFTDYRECEYLLLTGTNDTLNLAKEIVTEEAKKEGINKPVIPYAVNMNTLTNVIWYRLSSKLKATQPCPSYPSNVSSVLKAQVVLSSLLGKSISKLYEDTAAQYKNKKISKDDCISRIINYKDEEILPENINEKNVDKICSFITQDDMNSYKDDKKILENEIKRKDNEINRLRQQKRDEKLILDKNRRDDLYKLNILKDEKVKLYERKRKIKRYHQRCCKAKKIIKRTLLILAIFIMMIITYIIYQYGIDSLQSIVGIAGCIIPILGWIICPDDFYIKGVNIKNINTSTELLLKYIMRKRYPEIDVSCLETEETLDSQIKELQAQIDNILTQTSHT